MSNRTSNDDKDLEDLVRSRRGGSTVKIKLEELEGGNSPASPQGLGAFIQKHVHVDGDDAWTYNSLARSAQDFIDSAVEAFESQAQQPSTELKEMEARKDAAYLERNQVVAALAKCFPSGTAKTAIEGWSEDWHSCVYIDLPTGQASWHYHDSQAYLFADLPAYAGKWDGHTTEEKYLRVAALQSQAQQESSLFSQSGKYDIENGRLVNAATRKPIPSHVPVFILIGNDMHARETIQFYRDKCEDVIQKTAVGAQLTAFVNYFNSYSHNIKQPDSELPPAPEGEKE